MKRPILILLAAAGVAAWAGEDPSKAAIDKWAKEFDPSSLPMEQRVQELAWFAEAAKGLRGMSLRSISEPIPVHEWERDVLTKAFAEVTGITVTHNIIGEGDVVDKFMKQLNSKEILYHAYVNDGDLKGTHMRMQSCVNLTDYMKGEGKAVTNPMLDIDDFLNPEFGQDYDKNQLQLPDQQFPILYWFRYDYFTDPALMAKFKETYKYDLGVPVTWAAYEDIAEFFSGHVVLKDGKAVYKDKVEKGDDRIYGHLDYGKSDISLGWRFTDAWLSLAGTGDKGLPNGLPVDEWGIRVENGVPVGSTVERGGDLDGFASVYALTFFIDMIKKYAPDYASQLVWADVGPIPGKGRIAQTIYYCGTFIADPEYTRPGSAVCDEQGNPKWRLAPQPHGKYWEEGMKVGYQDAGSWTLPLTVTGKERQAAWLWAQFCVSKTVCLKKFLHGKTPIRKSTVFDPYLTPERCRQYGGLVEFYRSPARKLFTDTGLNVPNYPMLQNQWYQYISKAVTGELSPQQAMSELAKAQDTRMSRMPPLAKLSPKLAAPKSREEWLNAPGAPKPEIQGRGEAKTVAYDEMIKQWKEKELR